MNKKCREILCEVATDARWLVRREVVEATARLLGEWSGLEQSCERLMNERDSLTAKLAAAIKENEVLKKRLQDASTELNKIVCLYEKIEDLAEDARGYVNDSKRTKHNN